MSNSLISGERLYYEFAFATNGVTLRLNVTTGTIICYASDLIQRPNEEQGYVWMVTISAYLDVFLDPGSLNRPAGSSLYITLEGSQTSNNFNLNSSTGDRRCKIRSWGWYYAQYKLSFAQIQKMLLSIRGFPTRLVVEK